MLLDSRNLILQDIAAEVGNITPSGNSFGGNRGIAATYTKQGPCPSKGVHPTAGSIYIGTYSKDQWLSDEVKSHHDEIRDARSKQSNGPPVVSRNQKRRINAVKRVKNKLKKLKAEVAAIQQHKACGQDDKGDQKNNQNGEGQNSYDNAGDAFGGKRTKGKDHA